MAFYAGYSGEAELAVLWSTMAGTDARDPSGSFMINVLVPRLVDEE